MLTGLVLMLAAAPPPAQESWELDQVRRWLTDERGPGSMASPASFDGGTPIPVESAKFKEVAPLLRHGCMLTAGPAPELPNGRLAELDVDGDGVAERVFSGGCSPEPYWVALKVEKGSWAVWKSGTGRLLEVQQREGGVVFVAATDGYGVSREATVRLVLTRPEKELGFAVVGQQPAVEAPKVGEECAVGRVTKLRSDPKVDDAPQESGMGFDYPGNLLQVLAKGSSGWVVGRKGGWKLCAFPTPAAVEAHAALKAMRTPVVLTVSAETKRFVLGWVQ